MALSFIQSLPEELLETILLQLPIFDLLFCQSVCKRWQATVKDSPNVRKALFLGGDPDSLMAGHSERAVENRLLHDRFSGWKMLGTNDYGDPITRFRVDDTWPAPIATNDSPNLQHPSSSWRQMFLTQPPCEDVKFFPACGVKGWDNDSDSDGEDEDDGEDDEGVGFDRGVHRLHCDGGITMGALTQAVETVYYSKPRGYWNRGYRYTMWVLKFRN